jgi:hypothetical protein
MELRASMWGERTGSGHARRFFKQDTGRERVAAHTGPLSPDYGGPSPFGTRF